MYSFRNTKPKKYVKIPLNAESGNNLETNPALRELFVKVFPITKRSADMVAAIKNGRLKINLFSIKARMIRIGNESVTSAQVKTGALMLCNAFLLIMISHAPKIAENKAHQNHI